MTPAPIMSDDFLTDCKGKTICISYSAMCENLVRAESGSWIGIQITYNTDTSGTSVYNVMTVTANLNSGTKPWTRYRVFTTIPTTAVSVRSTMLTAAVGTVENTRYRAHGFVPLFKVVVTVIVL